MTFDMNDAEPQGTGELIPNGTFAKVTMTIRRGGSDGESEIDRGLLKESNSPGSDVKSLDTEFTVTEGPYARRKFWQLFTVSGGKVDDNGVSIGWKISKNTFRAMIDSGLGLDPKDMSEAVEKIRDRPASRLMRSNEGAMREGRQAGPSSSILTVRPTAPATATSASVGSTTADGSTPSSRGEDSSPTVVKRADC